MAALGKSRLPSMLTVRETLEIYTQRDRSRFGILNKQRLADFVVEKNTTTGKF